MAKSSDLQGEISAVAAATEMSGYRSMDDQRRKRDALKRNEALSLRLAGLTYDQIADRLNISHTGVVDLVNRTLSRAENRQVEEMRDIENARLDRAQASIWTAVLNGNLKAVDSFLRISQRRARLNGLDEPTKINLSVSVRQEMEMALASLERTILGEVIRDVIVDESREGTESDMA